MPHVNESERMYIEMGKNKDEREREAKGHFAIFFMTNKFNGHTFCGQMMEEQSQSKEDNNFF